MNATSIFIVGIKGVAMSHIAVILKQMGKKVNGTDVGDDFITDLVLHKHHIVSSTGFDITLLPEDTDLVLYAASHGGTDNPLVKEAKKRSITVVSQAEFLGELTKMFQYTLAVSGCHGKTTTSSLLAYSLISLKVSPSYMIGAPSFSGLDGGTYGKDQYLVIEADEYGVNPPHDSTPKFHYLSPTHIINTNIDFDHPDIYRDINDTKKAYLRFFSGRKLYLCADDPVTCQVINDITQSKILTYGYHVKSDLRIDQYDTTKSGTRFTLFFQGKSLGEFDIGLFGEKNILNTAGVVLLLLDLGFGVQEIKTVIAGFSGVKRRFEKIYEHNDTFLFDDYAHHPNEISATINAFRVRFPERRLIIIFQPHTFSRTASLSKEFTESLRHSDKAYILPIFPSAREDKTKFNISSQDLEEGMKNSRLIACADTNKLFTFLSEFIKAKDIVCTMGAGDVYKLKNDIIKIIKTL